MDRMTNLARQKINRRGFLKLAGTGLAASLLPVNLLRTRAAELTWPRVALTDLPGYIQSILRAVPTTTIDPQGYIWLHPSDGSSPVQLPQVQTKWNQERSNPWDQLDSSTPWGIVLHWFGDRRSGVVPIEQYLYGFDGLKHFHSYTTRTSSHFLISGGEPSPALDDGRMLGIVQTQKPSSDGTPYLGSHIQPLNPYAATEGNQYFVTALNQLSRAEPKVHSILQDFFAGRLVDPNFSTIALEIGGYDFDEIANRPSVQKIANVVSVVWALMKRYKIQASNILGHHEVQLSKADPGKKFLTLVRFLIAVKALVDPDEEMKELVYDQFRDAYTSGTQSVEIYWQFLRDYLLLTSTPRTVYEWEAWSQYWFIHDLVLGSQVNPGMQLLSPPLMEKYSCPGKQYLNPENHAGADLYPMGENDHSQFPGQSNVHLIGDGRCLYIGKSSGVRTGKKVIFHHRQADGTEVLSIYENLSQVFNVRPGDDYPRGAVLGRISDSPITMTRYLNLSIAYGAAWEQTLKVQPDVPLNAGPTWIRSHFMDPIEYLGEQVVVPYWKDTAGITPL